MTMVSPGHIKVSGYRSVMSACERLTKIKSFIFQNYFRGSLEALLSACSRSCRWSLASFDL